MASAAFANSFVHLFVCEARQSNEEENDKFAMVSADAITSFIETCRQFELRSNASLTFRYFVTSAQDEVSVMIDGRDGSARITWSSEGFVSVEEYTLVGKISYFRRFETKNGWEFLAPSLQELSISQNRGMQQ